MMHFPLAFIATLLFGSATAELPFAEREMQTVPDQDISLSASAFVCDENHDEVLSDRPLEKGASVRICIETARPLKIREIYIMRLNSFKFYKKNIDHTVTQLAVDSGSQVDGTKLFCIRGSELCSFVTKLKDNFFTIDGVVQGIGSVAMQYGGNERRELEISLRGRRETQEFAGTAPVGIEFAVEDGWNKKALKEAKFTFQEHWNESPAYIQGLYVTGILVLLLLICCFCSGIIMWRSCCMDIKRRIYNDDDSFEETEVYEKREEASETHSVDDGDWGSKLDEEDESEGQYESEEQYESDDSEEESEYPRPLRARATSRKVGSERQIVVIE